MAVELLSQEYDDRFRQFAKKAHIGDADGVLSWCNTVLPDIIRSTDSDFTDIYQQTNHHYYDRIRKFCATNELLRKADEDSNRQLSWTLKIISQFLQSRYYPKQEAPMEHADDTQHQRTADHHLKTISIKDDFSEGAKTHVEEEHRYRDRSARQACIDYWGYQCQCCGMDFGEVYGNELGEGYIQVHHLKPVSSFDDIHKVDPISDLVPLCANCHAMIHQGKNGVLTLKELREAYKGTKYPIKKLKSDE